MKKLDFAIQSIAIFILLAFGVWVLIDLSNNDHGGIMFYAIILLFLGGYQLLSALIRIIRNLIVEKKVSTDKVFSNYLVIVLIYFSIMATSSLFYYNAEWDNIAGTYLFIIPFGIAIYYYRYCYKNLNTITNT